MRQFVCLAHDVPTTPDFSLEDLPGGAGRLDAICRSITAALLRSHGVREETRIHVVVQDTFTIVLDGGKITQLHPDERSTAARIRTALDHRDEAIGAMPAEPSRGVALYRRGLAETLEAVGDGTIVELHEDGDPIVETGLATASDPVFVLSDHHDFTAEEADLLAEAADQRVRLGPTRLHADQAITVAHHFLDSEGYTRWEA